LADPLIVTVLPNIYEEAQLIEFAGATEKPALSDDELARIAELRLPEKGRHDEHYARVATALRRYLARQFDLPADRRTARELHQAMERAGIERRQAEAIYELLRENEAVRFERAQRQPRHAQQALADAMTALARARAAERRSAELVT
jgi:hypothetical protein